MVRPAIADKSLRVTGRRQGLSRVVGGLLAWFRSSRSGLSVTRSRCSSISAFA